MCADYGLFWVLFLVYFSVLCLPIKWLQVLNEKCGFYSHLSSPLHILILFSVYISGIRARLESFSPTKKKGSSFFYPLQLLHGLRKQQFYPTCSSAL